jgi:molybdopterin-guanine dinucleotide biosynthesis protein A
MQSSGPASAAPRALVAVLAGGSGTRLGGAKAQVRLAGRPLISYPLLAARDAGLEAVVVAKRGTSLPPIDEQVVIEADTPTHPLCGVLAALAFARSRSGEDADDSLAAVLTVGCDMPFLTSPLLAWLAGLDGPLVVESAGRLQPVLARYTAASTAALDDALRERRSLAEASLLAGCRVVAEEELRPYGDPQRLCFNVNDQAHVALAEAWLGSSAGSGAGG